MKDNKIGVARGKILLAIILIVSLILIMFKSFSDGYKFMNKSDKAVKTYNSLEELVTDANTELNIPKTLDGKEFISIQSTYNKFYEVACDEYVLKMAEFIDINADTLGLYEKCENDQKFQLSNNQSGVFYIRYRTGYTEYPNCTILNWCDNNASYGILYSGIYSLEYMLKLINIDYKDLVPYKENQSSNDSTAEDIEDIIINEDNSMTCSIGNKFTITLPYVDSTISINDYTGHSLLYMDGKLCFVFVYEDLPNYYDVFKSETCIHANENLDIYYRSENPFENGSNAYNDYNKFVSTVNYILNSINYIS